MYLWIVRDLLPSIKPYILLHEGEWLFELDG